jgi:hypothetical protein
LFLFCLHCDAKWFKFCHMQDIFRCMCIAFHSTCSFFVLCASEVCFIYFYRK